MALKVLGHCHLFPGGPAADAAGGILGGNLTALYAIG